jgi:hypothetical protein
MNQQDTDMLQIAIGSAERFNEDAPTPANPDLFPDRHLLESLFDDSPENSSSNTNNWESGPDGAIVEYNICRPVSKPPQTCLDSETILSNTFRNVRDVVFSNDFYILALQVAHKEITDLYPFWQLRQASLSYELTIVGIGYTKDGATDPLQSYHTMDFPMTPKSIQQAPCPAHIQDYSTYPPKVELAYLLRFYGRKSYSTQNPLHGAQLQDGACAHHHQTQTWERFCRDNFYSVT